MSKDGISVDPTKVEVVTKWERPTTVTEVRSFLGLVRYYPRFVQNFARMSFLGLVGYYPRFVQNFARITSPLIKLTKKKGYDLDGMMLVRQASRT